MLFAFLTLLSLLTTFAAFAIYQQVTGRKLHDAMIVPLFVAALAAWLYGSAKLGFHWFPQPESYEPPPGLQSGPLKTD